MPTLTTPLKVISARFVILALLAFLAVILLGGKAINRLIPGQVKVEVVSAPPTVVQPTATPVTNEVNIQIGNKTVPLVGNQIRSDVYTLEPGKWFCLTGPCKWSASGDLVVMNAKTGTTINVGQDGHVASPEGYLVSPASNQTLQLVRTEGN